MLKSSALPSHIYIHIPFCKSKCLYCDFNSYSGFDAQIDDYFLNLYEEIKIFGTFSQDKNSKVKTKLETIYIGGGTPSYVQSRYIVELLTTIKKFFIVEKDCEITIECNPGTLTSSKVSDYKSVGINRVSIGLQAYSDILLSVMGRSHTAKDFDDAIKMFIQEGFYNISADIIIGLPGQTKSDVASSIKILTDYKIKHISIYSLSIMDGTPFFNTYNKRSNLLPDDEDERAMYWDSINFLKNKGYCHYEISNFSLPGFTSAHNIACWNGEEYLGFGAGAHSYLGNLRYSNPDNIFEYIKNIAYAKETGSLPRPDNQTQLYEIDKKNEYFLLGFRLLKGISETEFNMKFKTGFEQYQNILDKLISDKLITCAYSRYMLTDYGIDFANKVFMEFV